MGEDLGEQTPPWIDSMETILGSLHNQHVEACSISIVPEQLRKLKMEAYMPKIVSIGPLHKGTRTDLQYMEEIKWRCMHYLLHRAGPKEEAIKNLNDCSEAILALDELFRASYNVNDIKFNNYDLAKIMVLDGCFLLELLISGSEDLNSKLTCCLDYASPVAKVIRREEVLSDLIMLENQIPLLVLNTLSRLLFPHVFTEEDGAKTIHDLALSLLGYTPGTNFNGVSDFIGLVHRSFIDKEERKRLPSTAGSDEAEGFQGNKDLSISMAGDEDAKISHQKLKLQCCATSLLAAGVIIKPPMTEANYIEHAQSSVQKQKGNILVQMLSWLPKIRDEKRELAKNNTTPTEIRFDLNIRFRNRELEIPPLHITETTEDKWRNFIAWEVNRTVKEKFIGPQEGETRIECKFIWYAMFFQSLICCVHDIQLLRDKNVIVVHEVEREKEGKKKAMSNEDLLNFFRKLNEGVPYDLNFMDSRFSELFKELNSHPSAWNCTMGIRTITWHTFRCYFTVFRYFCRNAFWLLIREHIPTGWKLIAILAAGAGLALTAVQAYYSVPGHH